MTDKWRKTLVKDWDQTEMKEEDDIFIVARVDLNPEYVTEPKIGDEFLTAKSLRENLTTRDVLRMILLVERSSCLQ